MERWEEWGYVVRAVRVVAAEVRVEMRAPNVSAEGQKGEDCHNPGRISLQQELEISPTQLRRMVVSNNIIKEDVGGGGHRLNVRSEGEREIKVKSRLQACSPECEARLQGAKKGVGGEKAEKAWR